jgi:hypothetical protein
MEIAASPPPAGSDLAEHAAKLHREKYDHFLPDELTESDTNCRFAAGPKRLVGLNEVS